MNARPELAMAATAPERALGQLWLEELTVSKSRWRQMLRITGLVMAVCVVSMVLQVPEATLSAYLVFFVTGADRRSTLRTGVGLMVAVPLALLCALALVQISLDQPVLRVALLAPLIFLGMYFQRISPLGVLAFAIGFTNSFVLTLVDAAPAGLPLGEAYARALCWMVPIVLYPVALVVLWNAFFADRPLAQFLELVRERMLRLEAALRTPRGRDQLAWSVHFESGLLFERAAACGEATGECSALAQRLDEACRLALMAGSPPLLAPYEAEQAERALRTIRAALAPLAADRAARCAAEVRATELVEPGDEPAKALRQALQQVVQAASNVLGGSRHGWVLRPLPRPKGALWVADARSNPAHARFALKVTITTLSAYLLYTGLEWWGIHTAMITCFFCALGSAAETAHKMTLRLVGALIGAAMGAGAILWGLPHVDSVGGLALWVGAGTLVAAWFATASARLSYLGFQIAFAYFVCTLSHPGPSTDLATVRDRLIGIVIGNLITWVVFSSLWPERAIVSFRSALASAVDVLRAMVGDELPLATRRLQFHQALEGARRYAGMLRFERGVTAAQRAEAWALWHAVEGELLPALWARKPVAKAASWHRIERIERQLATSPPPRAAHGAEAK